MLSRNDLPGSISALRYHHEALRALNARLAGPETVMRKYDLEDARYHSAQRDSAIRQLDRITPTGIAAPYTPGVDREAQIEAFLNPPELALAAE